MRRRSWNVLVAASGGLMVTLGAALGVIAFVDRDPGEPGVGALALGGVVACPGIIALLGVYRRAGLWLSAGIVGSLLAFLSLAGLTLPLLPAGCLVLLAWARNPQPRRLFVVPTGVVTPLLVALMLSATVALFYGSDVTVAWETDRGGGSSSGFITTQSALVSLTITVLAIMVALLATTRRDRHVTE